MAGELLVAVPPSAGDASRFGVVLRYDNGWAIVRVPHASALDDAVRAGARTLAAADADQRADHERRPDLYAPPDGR